MWGKPKCPHWGHLTTTIQLSYTFSTYFTSVILKSSYKTKGHLKFMMLILSTITTEIYDYIIEVWCTYLDVAQRWLIIRSKNEGSPISYIDAPYPLFNILQFKVIVYASKCHIWFIGITNTLKTQAMLPY